MGDVLGAKAGHMLASEIHSVVGDDSVGDPEANTMLCQRNLIISCSLTLEGGTVPRSIW